MSAAILIGLACLAVVLVLAACDWCERPMADDDLDLEGGS